MIARNIEVIDGLLTMPYEGDPDLDAETRVTELASELHAQVPKGWQEKGGAILVPSLKAQYSYVLL